MSGTASSAPASRPLGGRLLRSCLVGLVLSLSYVGVTKLMSKDVDRVAAARPRAEKILREKFTAAQLAYPPGEMFLRGLKRERQLELWARNDAKQPFTLVATYDVAAASGRPGPKRKEGDRQVPEGFYQIDRFNPKSLFHLSLGLNYPNAADRVHSDPARPGGDIFIHGSNASIGCLAMTDPIIEEIYLAALDSKKRPIQVHVFPGRMNASDWATWREEQLKENPALDTHWQQLQPGYEAFEQSHRLPVVAVDAAGKYQVRPAQSAPVR